MKKLLLTVALVSTTGLVAVLAQIGGDPVFDRFDRNRDGQVTPDEVRNPQAFATFDRDGNGVITPEEYRQVAGLVRQATTVTAAQVDTIVKGLDQNNDGRLSREEAGTAPWFARADRNHDGVIDAAEIALTKQTLARVGQAAPLTDRPSVSPEELRQATRGPEILKPGEVGIGRMIPEATFTDLAGQTHTLSQLAAPGGVVIAMTSATCPVSKRYFPSLTALVPALQAKGLRLVLVNPFASEAAAAIQAQRGNQPLAAVYVHDADRSLATKLGARSTTEVFLVDAHRTLIYRGALDDQYGVDYSREQPTHRYLDEAIAAWKSGITPRIAATAAPGCELDVEHGPGPATAITYHRDVARILQQNCVECHRDQGIAPFALDDLAEVKDRAKVIRRVVTEGTMPPWYAAPVPGENPWLNDHSLSGRDRSDLLAWLDSSDRPLGSPDEAPLPRTFDGEWTIGKPDLILPLSRAYEIKASGFMPYQFDVVETQLTEDKWVTAYEILPSARDVVHHVLVNVHEPGSDARQRPEGVGGFWAAYVPGNGGHIYPAGFARKLPAGSRLSFQIHYTPSGQAKKERLRIGLVFSPTPPQYEVKTLSVANTRLSIPAGAAHHVETKTQTLPYDLPITSMMAHMHVRGRAFKFEALYADGRSETLLDLPRYDFNWQLRYDLKQPKLIPQGSQIRITAVYDNSAANKANPDPTKLVRWGDQTVDEMMIGYFEYFVPAAGAKVAIAR